MVKSLPEALEGNGGSENLNHRKVITLKTKHYEKQKRNDQCARHGGIRYANEQSRLYLYFRYD